MAAIALFSAVSSFGGAWAQSVPPAVVQQVPAGSPLPRVLPPETPSVAPGLPVPAAPLQAPLSGARLDVTSAELRGSTVYPPGHFTALLAPLRGSVDQTVIEGVRQQILAAYRADGYVFTAVSSAIDPSGRLVFTATEGRIVEVKLDGNIGPAGKQVLRFLNHLTEASPIDIATLERWLLLAQDVPGITLRTVLRPSAGDPGALSLVAQVSRKKFSGLATADNRGYGSTGPEQFLASVGANSFSEYGERTDATFFYTSRSTELFGQVSTELFLGASGLKLRVYAGKGTTDPTGSLGQIGYHGDTFVTGTSLSYPVIRRRQQTLTASAYFDVLDSSIDTSSNGVSTLASRDNLRVVRLGADYAAQDVWLGAERGALSLISLRLSQGLDGLGSTRSGQLAARPGERVDFTKVSFEASRTQTLFRPWADATVAVQALVAGQYSGDVLPSSEKFFLGGLRFNRGFYSGQVTGDKALTAALELQLNTTFAIPYPGNPFDLPTQFYGFYDWGQTWESQRSDPNHRLASTGGGVRMYFPRAIEVDLEGDARLTRRPLGSSGTVNALPGSGFYWRVLGRF
jgi:hemolysin activation/secretion protein